MPGRRWWKPGIWPGFGPFSHLPPWERPGWLFGRGACWAYLWSHRLPRALQLRYPRMASLSKSPRALQLRYPRMASLSKNEEISALEEYKKELEDEKASIEEELREVEKRLEELKRGRSE